MNRRSFLSSIIQAGAGSAILPAAATYARRWKRTSSGLVTHGFPVLSCYRGMPGILQFDYIDELVIWERQAKKIISITGWAEMGFPKDTPVSIPLSNPKRHLIARLIDREIANLH